MSDDPYDAFPSTIEQPTVTGAMDIDWGAGHPNVIVSVGPERDSDDGYHAQVSAQALAEAFQKVENATVVDPVILDGVVMDEQVRDVIALIPVLAVGADRLTAIWVGDGKVGDLCFNADDGALVLLDAEQTN